MRGLKVWNGRGGYHLPDPRGLVKFDANRVHVNVCAHSAADARRLFVEAGGRDPGRTEVTSYWSNCWGRSMDGITPKRGIWIEIKHGQPILLYDGSTA